MEAKYKIGEFVVPVLEPTGMTKCQIIEIHKQKCPALIEQVTYLCRVAVRSWRKDPFNIGRELIRFNEIEVIPYVEVKESDSR